VTGSPIITTVPGLALKLNISDTAAMLAPYIKHAYRTPGIDSIYFVTGAGNVIAVKDSAGGGGGGVTTVGAFQPGSTANGASISGSNIYMHKVSATHPGMLSIGTDTLKGSKRFMDSITVDNARTITFGTSVSNPGFSASKRIIFDYNGTETYDIRSINQVNLVINVPTGRRLDIHAGNYTSGTGNIAQMSTTGITFGAQLNGNFGNLTNTLANSGGILSGSGTSQFGFAFNKFASVTYGTTIYCGTTGRIEFKTDGSLGPSSANANALITSTGLLVYGSATASTGGSSGARSAFTVATTTQGSVPAPLMTKAQRVALTSPTVGLQVFDTDSKAVWHNLNATSTTWGAVYAAQDTVATNANFTLPVFSSFVNLPTITANRTLTLPNPTTFEAKTIIVKVANSAGFDWLVSPAIKDAADADVSTLANDTVYTLFSDGTNWLIISIYQ